MKIFISHQKADTIFSQQTAHRLQTNHRIECYLDVIDPYVDRPIEDLAHHIRSKMSDCTQLLAIVSSSTKASQWVPWEIGVATEKDFPLATYSADGQTPPEFLLKWPYLRSTADLDQYAIISKNLNQQLTMEMAKSWSASASTVRRNSTAQFFKNLRTALRQ